MKTLKFLFFAFLLIFLFSNAYSQKMISKECETINDELQTFDCIGETCYYEYEQCTTTFESGKTQVKINGTLRGVFSGDIYTVYGVENLNLQNLPSVGTMIFNMSVVNEAGMVVAIMQFFGHVTTNANGTVTVQIFESTTQCF